MLRRAQVLLELDLGDQPERVARRYQISRSTVYNWIARYRERGPGEAALRDLPRPGRPRKLALPGKHAGLGERG